MSTGATDVGAAAQDEELFCYGHPNTPTKLRCSRCDRPICGRCAIPASVGQHCPECVAEARRSAPRVRTVLAATAPATRAILIVTGIAFLAQYMVIGFTDRMAMVPLLLAHGEWWRLLTPALVHGGGFHFIMNGYVLFMIGPAVEQRYGVARFVAIYVMAAIGGSVASFAFNEINIFGVGASGAILGLIGAFMADLYQRRNFANARLQLAGMWRWLGMIFGIGIAFQILSELGMRFFLIDNFAHAGGLVMGAAIGYGLGTKESKGRSAAIFVAVAVIALYAGLFVWRVASITS